MADIDRLLAVADITSKSRVTDKSRKCYDSKIKYCIKFMEGKFPEQVETDASGIKHLKLPLTFRSIQTLFAFVQIDVDLPKDATKRKLLETSTIADSREPQRQSIRLY